MSFCLRPNTCKKCGKPLTMFEGWVCLECEKAEQDPYICDTCKHKGDGWDTEPCDGCCGNHSGYEPCDDAVSRILKRMWNCRGKHTTSIDKVKMEQIIRDELSFVTKKTLECDDTISREYLKKIAGEYGYVSAYDIATAPSVTQKSVIEDIKADLINEANEHMTEDAYEDGVRFGLMLAEQIISMH